LEVADECFLQAITVLELADGCLQQSEMVLEMTDVFLLIISGAICAFFTTFCFAFGVDGEAGCI